MAEGRPWSGRASFAIAIAVAAVALVIGSGAVSSSPPTAAQRASALESRIRCPSCDDISVAESQAGSAIAVRDEISRLVAAGESDSQVESRLVSQYGQSILLEPPASGLSLVVWVVPLVAGALAIAVLATVFWRRSAWWHRMRREAHA